MNHLIALPDFITFVFPEYTIKPKAKKDIGLFKIKGIIFNKYGELPFILDVNVINSPPELENKI